MTGEAERHEALGASLEAAGRHEEAAAAYLEALRLDRGRAAAHLGLARIFDARGDTAVAEAGYRQVLQVEPGNAPANARLGQILAMSRVADAEEPLRRALAADPADAATAHYLSYVLRRLNRVEEAKAIARAALERHPDNLEAHLMLSLALPPVPASIAQIASARQAFARGLDALQARAARFAADPAQVLALHWENFALAYHGEDDRQLQEGYGRFVTELLARVAPALTAHRPRRSLETGERLRVGFLSSYLYECTIGKYYRSWITDLDPGRFEVFAYHTGRPRDALTASIEHSGARLRSAFEPALAVARKVVDDRLDVLVFPDVGMETTANLLAAMRLAPVQCAGWGHPVTTGLPTIDHFLTCGEMEPEGAEAHYSEHLVRLPGIGVRYDRPEVPGDGGRARLGLPADGSLYLCPQSAFKIHPDNDALFASVLAADPRGRLVFFEDFDGPLTAFLKARLESAFASRGVDPARALFLPRMGHADYLRVNAACDVMLDTLRWSGGNTTLDAIAAGLPVVTLPGAMMRGRQSLGMLRIVGVEELVARDEAEYVRVAVRLASDREWRARISGRLVAGSRRLFGRREPVEALAAFLETLRRP